MFIREDHLGKDNAIEFRVESLFDAYEGKEYGLCMLFGIRRRSVGNRIRVDFAMLGTGIFLHTMSGTN